MKPRIAGYVRRCRRGADRPIAAVNGGHSICLSALCDTANKTFCLALMG
jgi:hypothetical protein